ncbi:hypothetical protein BT93_H1733 [Corymbia citriodora subsp. variegata]|nr:hypothetical protein BT93_H1733 [Corymbia citriodora subsp. variegata]
MGVCYGKPHLPTPSSMGNVKSGQKPSASWCSAVSNNAARDKKASGDGKIVADPSLTLFSFAELKEATKNFRADALLGEGGFGRVYKGTLHGKQQSGRTETIVAVKVLNPAGAQGYTEWGREINFLGGLSHPNLTKLLGYCREDANLALVYEFMPMGSLEKQLFRKSSTGHLGWDVRLKIAVGAARGLAFLHNSNRKIIFRDFKSSNILLDESYMAKLTDFGLVRRGPPEGLSHVSTQFMGTFGYAAPEYKKTGRLYVKSDVYSFGIVLLEILTGLRACDPRIPQDNATLLEWTKPFLSSQTKLLTIMDSRLKGNYNVYSAFQIAQLALKCVEETPQIRPSMTIVVEELESIEAANAPRMLLKA